MPAPMTTTFALVSFFSGSSDGVFAVAIQTELVVPEVGRMTPSRGVDMRWEDARNMPIRLWKVRIKYASHACRPVLIHNKTSPKGLNQYGQQMSESQKRKSPRETSFHERICSAQHRREIFSN